jgi:glucose-6-phosphate 1-dehydrogenase
VPFYLRTGTQLAAGRPRLTVTFRDPPRRMLERVALNQLVFDLGGRSARFLDVPLRFDHGDTLELEPYERSIHDALIGDRTLFMRADGIERLWEVAAPVLAK